MAVTKQIVCLANSRKSGGRCVAGLERGEPPLWVRPISDRPAQEVSLHEQRYQMGGDPELLDIIDLPLLSACPEGHQSENWLLDPNKRWVKDDEASWGDLKPLARDTGPLWINVDASGRGQNNRIEIARIGEVTDSLRLIHVPRLTIRVSSSSGKTYVDGKFIFDGTNYILGVTDPIVETAYKTRPSGDYELGECYLTVSVGEEFHGYHYKLIAGLMAKDG